MGRAGRPLDDGVTGAGRAIVTAMLTATAADADMVTAHRLEILGLVADAAAAAATGAAPQDVRAAAAVAQEVRGGVGAPLQLLQLGPVLRAAGHASGVVGSVTPAESCEARENQVSVRVHH